MSHRDRNHYFNDAQLEHLAASDDADVRTLVELVRSLAAENLLEYMQKLGRKYLQDERAPGLDRALWATLQRGPERLDEDEVMDLDQLSQMAGGWWRLDDVPDPEFLSFDDWKDVTQE